jgi:hypothetical protein
MTRQAALAHALFLSITAPNDEQSQQALQIAINLADQLTEAQVEAAKNNAMQLVENKDSAEIINHWQSESIRGRAHLCREAGESIFAARRDYPSKEMLNYLSMMELEA